MERGVFIFEHTNSYCSHMNKAIYQVDFVSYLGLVKSLVSKQEFAVQWGLEKEDLS